MTPSGSRELDVVADVDRRRYPPRAVLKSGRDVVGAEVEVEGVRLAAEAVVGHREVLARAPALDDPGEALDGLRRRRELDPVDLRRRRGRRRDSAGTLVISNPDGGPGAYVATGSTARPSRRGPASWSRPPSAWATAGAATATARPVTASTRRRRRDRRRGGWTWTGSLLLSDEPATRRLGEASVRHPPSRPHRPGVPAFGHHVPGRIPPRDGTRVPSAGDTGGRTVREGGCGWTSSTSAGGPRPTRRGVHSRAAAVLAGAVAALAAIVAVLALRALNDGAEPAGQNWWLVALLVVSATFGPAGPVLGTGAARRSLGVALDRRRPRRGDERGRDAVRGVRRRAPAPTPLRRGSPRRDRRRVAVTTGVLAGVVPWLVVPSARRPALRLASRRAPRSWSRHAGREHARRRTGMGHDGGRLDRRRVGDRRDGAPRRVVVARPRAGAADPLPAWILTGAVAAWLAVVPLSLDLVEWTLAGEDVIGPAPPAGDGAAAARRGARRRHARRTSSFLGISSRVLEWVVLASGIVILYTAVVAGLGQPRRRERSDVVPGRRDRRHRPRPRTGPAPCPPPRRPPRLRRPRRSADRRPARRRPPRRRRRRHAAAHRSSRACATSCGSTPWPSTCASPTVGDPARAPVR